ncbi:MAG: hypothetical protein QOI58_3069 [Thermoanaerobaculia bacterium]|jgi:hypothetical protein|nr:hypothetical protein [Thermoanaerobaculia bacterium]
MPALNSTAIRNSPSALQRLDVSNRMPWLKRIAPNFDPAAINPARRDGRRRLETKGVEHDLDGADDLDPLYGAIRKPDAGDLGSTL